VSGCPFDSGGLFPVARDDPEAHDWPGFEALSLVESLDSAARASGKLGGVTGVFAGGTHVYAPIITVQTIITHRTELKAKSHEKTILAKCV